MKTRLFITLLVVFFSTTPVLSDGQPEPAQDRVISQPISEQLQRVPAKDKKDPQVWLVTRVEHAGVINQTKYAFGVGLKFKRHNWRLMYWPRTEKVRLDFQVRVD